MKSIIIISLLSSCHGLRIGLSEKSIRGPEPDSSDLTQKYWEQKERKTSNKELEDARVLGVAVTDVYFKRWEALEKLGLKAVHKFSVEGLMNVGLLKDQHDACVLALTGLENYQTGVEISKAYLSQGTHEEVCGHQVATWTAQKLKQMMAHPKFKLINNYLGSKQCSNVTVAGHSIGGAIAPIWASCVDRNKIWSAQNFKQGTKKSEGKISGFTVDRLYTYGAWAISKRVVTNDKSEGGCFNGIRFFRQAGKENDFWAELGQKYGFVHPKMRAMALITTPGQESQTSIKEYDCDDAKATTEPSSTRSKQMLVQKFFSSVKNIGELQWLHDVQGYTAQLQNILRE